MNNYKPLKRILLTFFILSSFQVYSQKISTWDSLTFGGINLRSIGPGFMSGRIADIAIDQNDENHWYVAAGSGGVWETHNSGVTFKPIFDKQAVYSIGCVTIDPSNSSTIWVGTGENVGGRHVSIGDGIYRSTNGGISWTNMGLRSSEHISKIIVHPTDPNIVWVAAQGPLWNGGGERGVYKTINGGKKWKKVLSSDEWTGATDLLIDPRNPDVLYAATWQRHRTVASYLGGGPKSGIHKSTDGGKTWTKLKTGLPSGVVGKIGLAISPINPDVVYAAMELELKKGGVYKSENQGASWSKMSDKVAGGTGPHYYQELWACPHHFDRIYLANNYLQVSNDGGKTFNRVPNKRKHVDNHIVTFKSSDPDYILVGTDGGLYESFDNAANWRHFGNLPLTQYYKIALDDSKPFYTIYGGTQDNNTQGGPSRTDHRGGIEAGLWTVVLGGDGHQPATEPGNPNIMYAQSQEGFYSRIDVKTGERVRVQPQPLKNDHYERYNWDAPILVSPHNPAQIYVASQHLWRSNDRGDSWERLSNDLTRNEERFDLPIMGRKQSYNNAWDVYAMSNYNTITSISESPLQRDLIYIGTDDGLIHVTDNAGKEWSTTDVKNLPGSPKRAYVNDIKADLHDANTVYLLLDNHKSGDYKPYVYVSRNKGKSWKLISSNLPENNYVWRIVQDHVNPNLLFIGTEFGLYTSINGGKHWHKLSGGLPTISIRDLAIQKRENDLVIASFGRGIYVFDDYSFLRELNDTMLEAETSLFSLRDADLFVPRGTGRGNTGSLGGQHFVGQNPQFGAMFTYFVSEDYTSPSKLRKKEERACNKEERDIDFPGWDNLEAEKMEDKVAYWLVIRDETGKVISRQKVAHSKGFHRVSWNLRSMLILPISQRAKPGSNEARGFMVSEGVYTAEIVKSISGELITLSTPVQFHVNRLHEPSLAPVTKETRETYYEEYLRASGERNNLNFKFNELNRLASALAVSLLNASGDISAVHQKLNDEHKKLKSISKELYGYQTKNQVGEKNLPSINSRITAAGAPMYGSLHGPTQTSRENLKMAQEMMTEMNAKLDAIAEVLNQIEAELDELGAPPLQGFE